MVELKKSPNHRLWIQPTGHHICGCRQNKKTDTSKHFFELYTAREAPAVKKNFIKLKTQRGNTYRSSLKPM